jgi:hypothetical protein
MPPEVPALGHDVSTDYRTHSVDLSAQKLNLSAPDCDVMLHLGVHIIARDTIHRAIVRWVSNVGALRRTVNHRRVTCRRRHVRVARRVAE